MSCGSPRFGAARGGAWSSRRCTRGSARSRPVVGDAWVGEGHELGRDARAVATGCTRRRWRSRPAASRRSGAPLRRRRARSSRRATRGGAARPSSGRSRPARRARVRVLAASWSDVGSASSPCDRLGRSVHWYRRCAAEILKPRATRAGRSAADRVLTRLMMNARSQKPAPMNPRRCRRWPCPPRSGCPTTA